jgi:hypothetical protein
MEGRGVILAFADDITSGVSGRDFIANVKARTYQKWGKMIGGQSVFNQFRAGD